MTWVNQRPWQTQRNVSVPPLHSTDFTPLYWSTALFPHSLIGCCQTQMVSCVCWYQMMPSDFIIWTDALWQEGKALQNHFFLFTYKKIFWIWIFWAKSLKLKHIQCPNSVSKFWLRTTWLKAIMDNVTFYILSQGWQIGSRAKASTPPVFTRLAS